MKIIITLFVLLAVSFPSFVLWRYYDQFNWCREEIRDGVDYSTEKIIKKVRNPWVNIDTANKLKIDPFMDTTSYKTTKVEYFTYPGGDKYKTYDKAFKTCKSKWSENLI